MSESGAEELPDERLSYDRDRFDELYLRDVEVHLERLDRGSAYLHIWGPGKEVHLDLAAEKGRLLVTVNISDGVRQEYSE